jgi:hypothetical protein
MGEADRRGTKEDRARQARPIYKGTKFERKNQIGDYIFHDGIPKGVLDFCKHPRRWQDVLQRPYNLDTVLQRYVQGDYGKVRLPEILVRKSGTAMFAVGSQYWTHSHLSSFRGCLSHMLLEEIGASFFEEQRQLDPENRHPLAIWHSLIQEWQTRHRDFGTIPEIGGSVSWVMLAYQIYLLKENSSLPSTLLDRLRNNENFQGARYEIYVAAMMVVCGYKISWIPWTNETSVEFIATHPNGKKFAVEAKSRHRPGILKAGATAAPEAPNRIDFQSNIIAGIRKNPDLPLLLFVDANVPYMAEEMQPQMIAEVERAWTKRINRKEWESEGFPCVGIVVTNDTLNWKIPVDLDLSKQLGWVWSSTGPHRHGFDATRYLAEIVANSRKANIVPDIQWTNMNPLPSTEYSKERIVELLD